nr:MBL fold metallo-hydrolase [Acidipropionibacterium jensenii]
MRAILPDIVAVVLIVSFVTGPWQANCYLVAAGPGSDCVVVDPGVGALEMLSRALSEHQLRPAAVAVTHGHIDHVGSAREICRDYRIPVLCPVDDRNLLSDPMAALMPEAAPLIEQFYGTTTLEEPDEVVDVAPDSHHELAGFDLQFLHAPGHTPGCSMIRLVDEQYGPIVMSGDVVFAGSVGRTDMPEGDPSVMATSLARVVGALDDSTHLLPGHGPATTMDQERRTNPYLQGLG